MNRKLLLVEDSKSIAAKLRDSLEKQGFDVDTAHNGMEALELFESNPYPVVLTDLEMPVMDGERLIIKLNTLEFPPVIFVITVHDDYDTIVRIMKLGVYDYFRKDVSSEDLANRLNNAFEVAELRKTKILLEKEKVVRLENQLSWYKWQEKANASIKQGNKSMFEDMQRAFNQGVGTGALITCLDMMTSGSRKTEEGYLVEPGVYEFVVETIGSVKNAMDMMTNINLIQESEPALELLDYEMFHWFISQLVEDSRKLESIRKNRILLSDPSGAFQINVAVDTAQMEKAIGELIINALKYSVRGSDIHIMVKPDRNGISVIILNEPVQDSEGRKGIPMGYEAIIFEPFFRLNKSVQEDFPSLDYGLGLPFVENVVVKHGGTVEVSNIKDHSDFSRGVVEKVMAVLYLPAASEELSAAAEAAVDASVRVE